jgi:cobalt-zinc-cadmium efflux system outer membrane protein
VARAGLLALTALLLWVRPLAAEPAALGPSQYADEPQLLAWLWQHSPSVVAARADADLAGAAVVQAGLWQNPQLDAMWGTIPIGQTTPAGLSNSLGKVSNLGMGLSQQFEPGKRPARKALAQSSVELARMNARDVLNGEFFGLLEAIGRVALTQVRQASFEALVTTSSELLELQRARAGKGDVAGVDVTRAEVEHQRLLAQWSGLDRQLVDALAGCAALVGTSCQPFADSAAARTWLQEQHAVELPSEWSESVANRRSDIVVLQAQAEQARRLGALADTKRIPDVSARLGYLWDNFVISGNQQQSISLGVGVSLPVLDAGQADHFASRATLDRTRTLRAAIEASSKQAFAGAVRRLQSGKAREQALDDAIARAAKVVEVMNDMHRRGAISLTELILARQAWRSIVLERLDLEENAFDAVLVARRSTAALPRWSPP